jgi:hypothetical protein
MKTGLREAIKFNGDLILFLDADITPQWFDNLVDVCINCGRRILFEAVLDR